MSAPRTPIAILASGRGSNFEAIAEAVRAGRLEAEIVAVVSDKPQAAALDKARALGLRAIAVAPEKGEARSRHEARMLEALAPFKPRFLVLAGYMRILTPTLIEAFRSERGYSRIVNIHPSLLPAFPGVGGYAQALQYGCALAGATVHLVELEVDGGPICAQEAFAIGGCRSAEEVERLGLAVEHRLYADTLRWLLPEKFEYKPAAPQPSQASARGRVIAPSPNQNVEGGPTFPGEGNDGGAVVGPAPAARKREEAI